MCLSSPSLYPASFYPKLRLARPACSWVAAIQDMSLHLGRLVFVLCEQTRNATMSPRNSLGSVIVLSGVHLSAPFFTACAHSSLRASSTRQPIGSVTFCACALPRSNACPSRRTSVPPPHHPLVLLTIVVSLLATLPLLCARPPLCSRSKTAPVCQRSNPATPT